MLTQVSPQLTGTLSLIYRDLSVELSGRQLGVRV